MDNVVTVMCPCGHLNQFQGVPPASLHAFQCSAPESCGRCCKPLDMEGAYIEPWHEPRSHDPFDYRTGSL